MPGCASASPTPASSSAAVAAASTSASVSTTISSSSAAARSRRTRFRCRSSGMVSSEISISLRLRGVSHVLSCGCTSSTDAIGYGAALIRSGDAEVVLSGGTDACVTPGMLFGFSRMKVVSMGYNDRPAVASRPFDRGRDGFVLGEGAWMLVLEREDRARARGASIYASIDGYGSTCDAYHRVQMAPDGEEIVRALSLAIDRSGRSARNHRLRQLSRHRDGVERCRRVAVRPAGVRRSCGPSGGIVREIDDRPPAGRERRRRRRHGRAGALAPPAARRRSTSTTRIRPAIWISFPIARARWRSKPRSATASGSDRRTARSWSDACDGESGHRVIRAVRSLIGQ